MRNTYRPDLRYGRRDDGRSLHRRSRGQADDGAHRRRSESAARRREGTTRRRRTARPRTGRPATAQTRVSSETSSSASGPISAKKPLLLWPHRVVASIALAASALVMSAYALGTASLGQKRDQVADVRLARQGPRKFDHALRALGTDDRRRVGQELRFDGCIAHRIGGGAARSEEHTSELQSLR